MHRGQLIQTGPTTIRVRLSLCAGIDAELTWRDVLAKLSAYLVEQHLDNVVVVRAQEPPEQKARFGNSARLPK